MCITQTSHLHWSWQAVLNELCSQYKSHSNMERSLPYAKTSSLLGFFCKNKRPIMTKFAPSYVLLQPVFAITLSFSPIVEWGKQLQCMTKPVMMSNIRRCIVANGTLRRDSSQLWVQERLRTSLATNGLRLPAQDDK